MIKALIRISLLITIVVLGFTIIMPGWYHNLGIVSNEVGNRFKDNATVLQQEAKQYKENQYKELAQIHKMSVDEYKDQEFDSKVKYRRYETLKELARTNQHEALASLLSNVSEKETPVSIFAQAIQSGSVDSFNTLLNVGVSCDYETPLGNQAFLAAINSHNTYFFMRLIESGCKTAQGKYNQPLVKILRARKRYKLMLAIKVTEAHQYHYDRVFDTLITKGEQDLAMTFLQHGISQKQLTQSLRRAIKKDFTALVLAMIESGADFSVDAKYGLRISAFNIALMQANMTVLEKILQLDPGYISREEKEHGALFYSIVHSDKVIDQVTVLEFLFANGLNINKFKRQGFLSLVELIKAGKVDLIKTLIKHGAETSELYRGYSLIEVARQHQGQNISQIIQLLKNAGVAETGLSLAEEELTKQSRQKKCQHEKLNFDFNKTINEIVEKNLIKQPLNKMEQCEVMLLSCTKEKHSLDDCMYSVPVCEEKQSGYCCDSAIKTNYLDARCAGISTIEAVYRIPDLTTQYTVPIILQNEIINQNQGR